MHPSHYVSHSPVFNFVVLETINPVKSSKLVPQFFFVFVMLGYDRFGCSILGVVSFGFVILSKTPILHTYSLIFSARSSSQTTLDSLDWGGLSEDGEGGVDERVAVLEFELRKARQTIQALRANLTQAAGESRVMSSPISSVLAKSRLSSVCLFCNFSRVKVASGGTKGGCCGPSPGRPSGLHSAP